MASPKPRVVADPSIGIADLLLVLETWLDAVGNSHMSSMLKPPKGTTWKTSAVPEWLCKLAPLWKSFLKLAPNGVLPSKKHRQALEKLQDRREVNPDGKLSVEDFAITMDEWIRIGLSQLRGIKGCELNRTRCLRKATPEEQETLEEVMGYLVEIDLEDGKQQSGGSTGDMSQALVPYTCATSAEHVEASSQQKKEVLTLDLEVDPSKIFQAVLDRPSILEPHRGDRRETPKNSPVKFQGFFDGLIEKGQLDADERKLLEACQHQEPLNKGYSSQLQRSNKERQKEGIATPKAKAKTKAHGKKGKGKHKHNTPKQKKAEDLKPPQAKSKDKKAKKKVKKTLEGASATQKTPDMSPEDPGKAVDFVPPGFDPAVSRAENRHRYTSRAHRKGALEAKHMGLEGEDRLAHARTFSKAASAEFDRLWPNPKKKDQPDETQQQPAPEPLPSKKTKVQKKVKKKGKVKGKKPVKQAAQESEKNEDEPMGHDECGDSSKDVD